MVLVYIGVLGMRLHLDFFSMMGASRKGRGKIAAFVWITCMDGCASDKIGWDWMEPLDYP